jgi:hypothetical protein
MQPDDITVNRYQLHRVLHGNEAVPDEWVQGPLKLDIGGGIAYLAQHHEYGQTTLVPPDDWVTPRTINNARGLVAALVSRAGWAVAHLASRVAGAIRPPLDRAALDAWTNPLAEWRDAPASEDGCYECGRSVENPRPVRCRRERTRRACTAAPTGPHRDLANGL